MHKNEETMDITVVNMTPHAIIVVNEEGEMVATYPPSGEVARVQTTTEVTASVAGIPVRRTAFGNVTGIPESQPGMVFITSTIVAQAAKRPDVISPDTGPTAVRLDGQVVAIRGFQVFS